jgi:hypothetical protein
MQQVIISQQDLYFCPENQRFENKMMDYAYILSQCIWADPVLPFTSVNRG